jgi:repressor LexA
MTDLTPRQTQILRLIQDAIAESGMPPTRAEIARTLGFKSPNAAEEHLRALQRKGVIDLIPGASRGIQLTRRGAHRKSLSNRSEAVSTETALFAQSQRHEHEGCGHPGW